MKLAMRQLIFLVSVNSKLFIEYYIKIKIKKHSQSNKLPRKSISLSQSFGHFAVKLDDSSRNQDEHFYDFYLRLQNIVRIANNQLERSKPQLSNLFIRQLDVLAGMVFVRKLRNYLYENVYKLASETLDDVAKLAIYIHSSNTTGIKSLRGEYSNSPTEIREEMKNYFIALRFKNVYTVLKQYDYQKSIPSAENDKNCECDRAPGNSATVSDHNSISDSEGTSKFSVSSERSKRLLHKSNRPRESDLTDSERTKDTVTENDGETNHPVLRHYCIRIVSRVSSNSDKLNKRSYVLSKAAEAGLGQYPDCRLPFGYHWGPVNDLNSWMEPNRFRKAGESVCPRSITPSQGPSLSVSLLTTGP
ncbi:hypothetical protein TSAR_004170, partial [Trichomalopsis sarcophagae]